MAKKIGNIEEIIYYGLEMLDDQSSIKMSTKDFILIYKSIEELRRFFHNKNHYSNLENVDRYIGDRNSGMLQVLNNLYMNTLDNLLTERIEQLLESDQLDSNLIPFYFQSK